VSARTLPLLATTVVGSWPRPPWLLRALREQREGRLAAGEFERVADRAVLEALRAQEATGIDIVTDGEQRRDNFYSFVATKLDGVRLMTLAELLDVVEDRASFSELLDSLDAPAYALSNPTCVGRIARREPLAVEELRFLRRHTDRPIKVPLPGPYLLTRAMWVPELSAQAYESKEALADDVVAVLRAEIAELVAEGVDFVQLDEPVLTELVFGQGRTRTFMCASLSASPDRAEELAFAASLLNRVLAGFEDMRTGVHVCRGNWSTNEATLLRGGYGPLRATLERIGARQLVLEYATERAGELVRFAGKELGLGVVNPRVATVEPPEWVARLALAAARMYGAEQVFLNTDCGFGTFAARPVSSAELAVAKLEALVAGARSARRELGAV
jgi:5-methyltetrahydropteroyltriglutamate--homocysteine methyltransferase